MMTNKQEWLILKLIEEIEEMSGNEVSANDLYFLENNCSLYATSRKEASNDISFLLRLKDLLESGSDYEDARKLALNLKED